MPTIIMALPLMSFKKYSTITITITTMLMISLVNLMQNTMMMNYIQQDNITNIMLMLTLFVMLITIMASTNKNLIMMIMMINITLLIAFSSSSLLTFYIFFELSIIPTFMLIMNDGAQPERLQASMYMLMYTIMASLPLLLSILMMNPSMKVTLLNTININLHMPLLFIMAFLVKLPMFSVHLWLPKAHVEAPMEGSMILAAILLKLGSYGLMRLMPLMKMFSKLHAQTFMIISTMGCIYTTLSCNRQKDMKAMVAYSSIAHMALIIMAMFSSSSMMLQAALLMSVSHALTSSGLFMLVTLTYKSHHSRNIFLYKGFMNSNNNMSMWWFLMLAANMGTPPFISLMSEISSISATLMWHIMLAVPILMAAMFMASFSIMMFSMINHNTPNQLMMNNPMKTSQHLTLFMHIMPLFMMMINPTMMN